MFQLDSARVHMIKVNEDRVCHGWSGRSRVVCRALSSTPLKTFDLPKVLVAE